jgi:hypothetical protein
MSELWGWVWIGILFVLCLVYSSCGRSLAGEVPSGYHEPELIKYLHEFRADATDSQVELQSLLLRRMTFEEMTPPQVGVCRTYELPVGNRYEVKAWTEVLIDPDFRFDTRLRALMYHELGHCLLGRGHSETGIMRDTMYPPGYYEENWDELVKELFR